MFENSAATNQGAAFDHERWLTMRAAYNQYKGASATLGALTAASLAGCSSPVRNPAVETAAAEQRAAFESYIEARLALSESMAFPARTGPATEGNALNHHNSRITRIVLLAAAAAWLFPVALSLENWVGQRRQMRDLEAVRDEARVMLAQTRNEVADFARLAEELKTAPKTTLASSSEAAAAGVKKVVRLRTPTLRAARKGRKIARNRQKWVLLD
jgi:hypothetical protein